MDNATQAKIYHIVADALRELGVPDASFSFANTTILIRDGIYLGHSMVCGHVKVLLLAGGERIEFYDQAGSLLRQIRVAGAACGRTAAA